MHDVTITLSDEDFLLAGRQAAKGGFAGVENYLRDLVMDGLSQALVEDIGPPEHLRVTSVEQLTEMVREGLASPARLITRDDFAEMRRELAERHHRKSE